MNVNFFDWDYLHFTALMKETYFRTLISILGSCACPKADLELKNQDPIPYFPLLFSELEVFWLNLASLVLDFFILTIPVPSQESLLPPALLVYALRLAPASYGPHRVTSLEQLSLAEFSGE